MDRKVIHYIDNTSAIAALVKGYSKKMDSGMIVNATHAALLGLGAEVYFDYVRSKRNVADWPSRGEVPRTVRVLQEIGIKRERIYMADPTLRLPSLEEWSSPASEWVKKHRRE